MVKLFIFDIETTGTHSKIHGIHQLAGKIIVDGKCAEQFNWNVQPFPGQEITEDALMIGKIKREVFRDYNKPKEIYKKLLDMLGIYCNKYDKNDKYYLVGFNNAAFDNAFFREFFNRNNDLYFGSWFWSNPIDVYILAGIVLMNDRAEMLNFTLNSVAEKLGIAVNKEKLHDAMYDIELTYQVYLKCMERLNCVTKIENNKTEVQL